MSNQTEVEYVFQPFRLLPAQRCLLRDGVPLKLGGRAFDLLVALVERRDRTVSSNELMEIVWPKPLVVTESNLQVQVASLRKLLGHAAVATIPGRGYRFTLPFGVQSSGPDAAAPKATLVGAPGHPGNLDPWVPQLLGREEVLKELLGLVRTHAWVTIVGSAGVGKTRLARVVAAQHLTRVPGGAWWVDLAPLTEAELLPSAVALALGIEHGGYADTHRAIAARVEDRETLLVLDNVEHLLDGVASFLTRLRPLAPRLRLLLTSQEALNAADEHRFRLAPLSLPGDESLDAAMRSGAVALFMARAQARGTTVLLDESTRPVVVDICRRLDGIPLALELAAARVSMLGLEGLRTRLDHRFELLTSGDRTASRRHRTLREAVEWSYRLLSEEEKSVFRRLGVLAGKFSIEAAQAIAEDGDHIDTWDVVEHLGALVDKSLVVAEGDPVPRYLLLETLRIFALERLIEHGEADRARTAHLDHFLAVAASARDLLRSPRVIEGLRVLDLERDNILIAMAWACAGKDPAPALRLAQSLRLYWAARDLIVRGLEFSEAALAHPHPSAASEELLGVQLGAATFATLLELPAPALDHAGKAVATARALADNTGLSQALAALATAHLIDGDAERALDMAEEAVAIARTAGAGLTYALSRLGAIHMRREEFELARTAAMEELANGRLEGSRRGELAPRLNLTIACTELSDLSAAREHLGETLTLVLLFDSKFFGAGLIGASAAWCVASGWNRSALRLYAALAEHYRMVGRDPKLGRRETLWRESARSKVEDAIPLEEEGAAWSYGDAIKCIRDLLDKGGD